MNKSILQIGITMFLALGCCACSGTGSTQFDGLLGGTAPVVTPTSLALTGPATVAPGVNTTGYVATYTAGTRGATNPGTRIELNAAGNANNVGNFVVVSPCGAGAVEQPANGGGNTDAQGRVCFNYTAPPSVTTPTTITLFATVPGQVDASNNPLRAMLTVTVQPATFQFVQPDSNVIGLSPDTATQLRFQWTRASGSGSGTEGVTGMVQLSATGGGQFTVDGAASGNPVNVGTSGRNGDFARIIGVYGNNSGAVNVTATDTSNGRMSSLTLQAMDTPTGISLDASPRQLPTSGTQTSAVTAMVTGQSGPAAGAQVTFTLTPVSNSAAEKLSVYSGTSGASGSSTRGQVVTQYSAGDRAGTASIQACVTDTNICSSTSVAVVAP